MTRTHNNKNLRTQQHITVPLTVTLVVFSIRPIWFAATQVYVADSCMLVRTRTLRPMDSGGVSSTEPRRHLTYGIGEPTATHVKLAEPPGITSTFSGGNEKCGARRITAIRQQNSQPLQSQFTNQQFLTFLQTVT